jgi:hypothetical protein
MQSQPLYDDDHERTLLKRELDAFERRQRALIAVSANSQVHQNGESHPDKDSSPFHVVLDEFKAADAEWCAARAECERAVDHIDLAS